ncbi:MAG: HAD hydrolase-like protein [Clostridia bacterium]|nr:HAD hydrolase-like protein [Clostridia bacterium]
MKYVFFDLDGTVTESAPGIINSVVYAIKKLGVRMPSEEELLKFVGPPLSDSFVKYCGVDPSKTKEAINIFREYFAERGIFENNVYPGIPELTAKLKSLGVKQILATSKPQLFAERILTHFNLIANFDGVYGNSMDEKYTDKALLLRDIIAKEGIKGDDLKNCVMVGDRSSDISGAHKAGIRAIGVLYGYGDRPELEGAGADLIVETVRDLEKVLTGEL